jgi:FAD:protein FMN transferase
MPQPEHLSKTRLGQATLTDRGSGYYEVFFFALGARCQLFFGAPTADAAEAFRQAAAKWLGNFETRFSRFLPDSELNRINAQAGLGWIEIDRETEVLLDICNQCHFVTEGAFDATSLPLTRLWDWKHKHEALPTKEEIEKAMALVGWKRLQRAPGKLLIPDKGMELDFGGVGKEFAVDCVKQLAVGMGIEQVLVDLGGDIAVHGESPEGGGWYVGIEDPEQQGSCHIGLRLKPGAAVATSGDYRRCFEFQGMTYGHILDCRTGWPVRNGTRAVTVIAPRCLAAGLLSTSAMVIGGTAAIAMLERTVGVQGCLWCNGQLLETRGFRRSVLPAGQTG